MTSPGANVAIPTVHRDRSAPAVSGEILRDIARGGLTGLIVGVVGAGIGGRIAMRIAALLVPSATGAFTENGNRIGEITLQGSTALVLVGVAAGVIGGAVWVSVSPWIPRRASRRVLVATALALAIGGTILIVGDNRDFLILDHHPAVVATLLALVAVIGLAFPLVDNVLDQKLPTHVSRGSGALLAYGAVSVIGILLVVPAAVLGFVNAPRPSPIIVADGILIAALATLAWWVLRLRGETEPPTILVVSARGGIVLTLVVGLAGAIPQVAEALGIR
jgi:hypothetical protein